MFFTYMCISSILHFFAVINKTNYSVLFPTLSIYGSTALCLTLAAFFSFLMFYIIDRSP
jgi:hypothetical protein